LNVQTVGIVGALIGRESGVDILLLSMTIGVQHFRKMSANPVEFVKRYAIKKHEACKIRLPFTVSI
jgi:hypothetical protein